MVEFKNIHFFTFYEPYLLNHLKLFIPDIYCYNHDLIIYRDYYNHFQRFDKLKYIITKDELW